MEQKITNAVIGYPLGHSLSPFLHRELYRRLNIDAEFVKDEGDDVVGLVERIKTKPYQLTAVTMPHKQSVISFLDEVDVGAKAIGSVNTITNIDQILHGYNTDILGIEYALRNVELNDKKVLLIGAGGVARTLAYIIKKHGGKLLIANRTRTHAEKLAEEFSGEALDFMPPTLEEIDVIINTTPIGMFPNWRVSPVPKEFLLSRHIVFDMIYNPEQTQLLTDAQEVGARTISGLDMFVAQGIRQVELWQGIGIMNEELFGELKELMREFLAPKIRPSSRIT